MKELKKDMKAITKELNGLIQKTEKMKTRLEKLEKTQTTKKVEKKAVPETKKTKKAVSKKVTKAVSKKATKVTAIDTVSKIFTSSRSSKGIDVATLKKKTGFDEKKIWNIIYSLKKQGKIKGLQYGLYIKS